MQLSLRYKTNDYFWFDFFHEAGHIIKHGKRDTVFSNESWENEADEFARNILISSEAYKYFTQQRRFSKTSVEMFAKSQAVHPAIVVARLQHDEYLRQGIFNDFKEKIA